jgi:hypothetical protein
MIRQKQPAGTPPSAPVPSWFMGVVIGMTIMTMAGTAMTLGAGLALSQPPVK